MIVRMAANGVLTIPSRIRRKLGMTARIRMHLDADEHSHKIVLTPVTHEYIQKLQGKYKGKRLLRALALEKKP